MNLSIKQVGLFHRGGLRGLALAGAMLVSTPAWALTCDEIVSMVGFDIPTNIVVQTIQGSGSRFTADDVRCLSDAGVPPEIVATAREMSAAEPDPEPTVTKRPEPEPEAGPAMEDLFDVGPEPDAAVGEIEEFDEERGPERVEELVRLYRAKKLLGSSKGLFDLLEEDAYPEYEDKIQYYLAKSLFDLGMYHSAQHYFMEVVRKGPKRPYFKYALPKMVAIAELNGNDIELLRIVHKIPPEAFPRQAKNHLYYLMGRKLYESGELAASARYFQQISPRSELYLRSKYFEAVIHNERGQLKSAVKSFRDVYQAEVPETADPRVRSEYVNVKELALMDIARIYYALRRYENADEFYALVDRGSGYWAESLYERAWSQFLLNDLNGSLGLLLTLQSPDIAETNYIPEAELVRSLAFFQLCEYDTVEQQLIRFERTYAPMRAEMETFLSRYSSEEGLKLADQAYDAYFENPHESALSKAFFLRLLRNRDLAALVRHLDMMEREQVIIDAQKGVWRDTIGARLTEVIESDRSRYKVRAGRVLLSDMDYYYRDLGRLISESELIRFEVVDAQRLDYEYKMQNPLLESEASRRIDFATSQDIIFWPFNGEFWVDELGYYRYTEQPACK